MVAHDAHEIEEKKDFPMALVVSPALCYALPCER